jgi:hypothetical protein
MECLSPCHSDSTASTIPFLGLLDDEVPKKLLRLFASGAAAYVVEELLKLRPRREWLEDSDGSEQNFDFPATEQRGRRYSE